VTGRFVPPLDGTHLPFFCASAPVGNYAEIRPRSVAESQAGDFLFALLGQLATMQNWLGGHRHSQRVTITMGTIAGTFKNFELVGYLEVARYAALK